MISISWPQYPKVSYQPVRLLSYWLPGITLFYCKWYYFLFILIRKKCGAILPSFSWSMSKIVMKFQKQLQKS